MTQSIPDVLYEAAQIFLEELNAHLHFFQEILARLQSEAEGEKLTQTEARLLAEKFHLIKGASGFLKLTELKESSAEAEKYFRDRWNTESSTVEARLQLAKSARVVDEHRSSLSKELKSSS